MVKKVVVTGLGVVSPVGTGVDKFWQSLLEGKSGINRITRFDASDLATQIAGEVKDFDPLDFLDKKEVRRMDRYTHYGMAAAKMAIEDAGLDPEKLDKDRVGVLLGSGVGGIETVEEQARILMAKGPGRISPFFVPMMIANICGAYIAINYGFRGPNTTTVTACASASNAIGEAMRLIKNGECDVVITGGAEAPIIPLAMAGFCSMKAMSTRNEEPEKASRPFDKERDGFVMGEGAGVLILESLEHAQKRGAKIYAELSGYGVTCDAYHITAPDPDGIGAARAMELAMREAGVEPEDVQYINAHGTSTPLGDIGETKAIKKVFGEHAYKLAVSSTKSMTGHLLGAAGGIEAAICILAIQKGQVPPTINLENPDPECDLDYVPNKAKEMEVRVALSNSFGFGGHNGTILFNKFEE
ncbi:3-oxoacyl-(acyl-carrier-protein) synthase 2 [Thermincola ferriacetica]|uniref:3-oxoacyl-[acyl-carrier-protein] synthase 2 n=1 Tax=Thermincola ferriacetica TaxID=281456 RepID=A0A0L6W235_9FIRM|nr:beta-ketoacyl-ACP synthase II [Thermincola ferriacetica]KNZ69605.1 3-oxoacyl-(acyl-carrier-protein) synthase 2 [Thermincola ferriacetica]